MPESPQGRRPRRTGWRRLVPRWPVVLGTILAGLIVVLGLFFIGYATVDVPDPTALSKAQATTVYYSDGKTPLGRFGDINRQNVALDQVPVSVQHAVIAAENRSFYTDNGISPTSIVRALWVNLRGGSTQGASTITQQYVKNTYLTQDRTWKRKLREFFITIKVDKELSKQQILIDYLNTIYFGRGAYGIQAAAQAYFGVDISKVTPQQGAVLAAVLNAPAIYDPAGGEDNKARLLARYHYVLKGMQKEGWLPEGVDPDGPLPTIKPRTKTSGRATSPEAGFLLDTVRRELLANNFSDQDLDLGGLRVTTTFDAKMQKAAVAAMTNGFPTKNASDVHAALTAVKPGDGAVLAMTGGPNDESSGLNPATQAAIQPGSTFKPFALTAALEKGISLTSRFDGNSPYTPPGGGKPVRNEFNTDYGQNVDLIEATAKSINTAYVDLVSTTAAKPSVVLDAAVRAGIPKDAPGLKPNVRIPLGTASVHPLDMADAYATFAAQGVHADWYTVREVRNGSGGLLYETKPQTKQVFDKPVMADLTYALTRVVDDPYGTARKAVSSLQRPAAGKTGTAALRNDTTTSSWFAGYVPQLAATVAFYRGDGTKDLDGVGGLSTFFGGSYPAQIWASFMKQALAGSPVQQFPPRADVGQPVNPTPSAPPTPTVSDTPTPSETPSTTTAAPPTPSDTATSAAPSTSAPATEAPSSSSSGLPVPSVLPSSSPGSSGRASAQSTSSGPTGDGGGAKPKAQPAPSSSPPPPR